MNITIERPWGISVLGVATVSAVPDFARVRLGINVTEDEPRAAFERGREVIAQIRQVARTRGIPDRHVSGSRLGFEVSYEWNRTDNVRRRNGYACSASFQVELEHLDDLDDFLVDMIDVGVTEINGAEFDVRAKPRLRAQAREKAVDAARVKAQIYAQAAGVTLGDVLHIEDVDPEGARPKAYTGHSDVPADSSDGDLAPGAITVHAAVALGFAIARDTGVEPQWTGV